MKLSSALACLMLLAACVDSRPPAGDAARPLRIATWNLEHLAERNGEGCRPRTDADYALLRRHAAALDADVIAFQEVESEAAARRVFTPDAWNVLIEARRDAPSGGCRGLAGQSLRAQKVGVAVRKGLVFTRHADLRELGLGRDGLRWGVDVTVMGPQPVRLLAVHLKSGCNSGRAPTDRDCDVLFAQLPVLERWVDARADEPRPFAVLGDWNRRLGSRGDAFWARIDDG
jgi:endonuclease/exonuclease/phosphatase family metal-dependent hydrolase